MAERTLLRRTAAITAVLVALPLWVALTPVWLAVSLIVDAFGRLWRFPTVRLNLFLIVYLCHEWVGIFSAAGLWVSGRFGTRMNLVVHRDIQGWWASSLLAWGRRLLNVHIELDDLSKLPEDRFIVLSRHASMVDALIPAAVVTGHLRRFVHYVLKRELRWDPSLDLFGTRLGNHFVARGADTEVEEAAINRLAAEAEPNAALVIFPEGTYASPRSRTRVLDSLRRRGELEVAERAEKLRTLLPPKPAGTLALFRGRPEADVVVVGHVGLEGVAQLRGLRRRLPLANPVRVKWWTYRRGELPTGDDSLTEWLAQRWEELDRWVSDGLDGFDGLEDRRPEIDPA